MATAAPDFDLLVQHKDKLPDYLKRTFMEAVVFHPMNNEEHIEECRKYIKKLHDYCKNSDCKNKSSYHVELYDDLEVGFLTSMQKLEYVNKCCAYKLIYLTSDFQNGEDEQKFNSDSALAASLIDPVQKESVIVVRQNKEVNVPSYLSVGNSLIDDKKVDPYHFDKIIRLFMSKETLDKRKKFEEETKREQIAWIKRNVDL